MQGQRGEAEVLQRLGHFIDIAAGIAEHHAGFGALLEQQSRQRGLLARQLHFVKGLLDHRLFRHAAGGDFQRVAHGVATDFADGLGKSRREQQCLPFLRGLADDFPDRFFETHVEHAVGFVQHQRADAAQVQGLLAHQFLDAAGGADDHVRVVGQRSQLWCQRHAAGQHQHLEVGNAAGQLAQLLADLVGKFAGGAQHQRLGADQRRVEPVQQAQAEGGGLAAAGRRLRDHVAPGEDRGQAFGLDRGHLRVADGFHALLQARRQAQAGEVSVVIGHVVFSHAP